MTTLTRAYVCMTVGRKLLIEGRTMTEEERKLVREAEAMGVVPSGFGKRINEHEYAHERLQPGLLPGPASDADLLEDQLGPVGTQPIWQCRRHRDSGLECRDIALRSGRLVNVLYVPLPREEDYFRIG